ncbi:hypothetical protein T440DRAFT_251912 [Plenodomus tracheiphilus IPT5]|uniref:BTB/POZ domain-containing protein n=1 Tax=Plenodomus tracheiphilus IPT5 TaxID=1408161 RepID=A0A6A7AS33_9PLEO|nr:hypothetical protein T440DRAFT_251912 [Plenodomus tracheiphilus IPT5]
MSDRDRTSQDFGFQPSDRAGEPLRQSHRTYGVYNTGGNINVPGTSTVTSEAAGQIPSIGYGDLNAQQHVAPDYASFGYNPSAALNWDWNGAIDFNDFATQYEPQGELVQEFQHQTIPPNDFTIPLPVPAEATDYQTFQLAHGAAPTSTGVHAQNISPPPPRRSSQPKPSVQAGIKRKVDSDLDLPVPQNASQTTENPNKRQNTSRHSSDASIASSVVAASPDTRPPSTNQGAATATTEPPSQTTLQEGDHDEQRKVSSKGTGPQGRVIDVSKPRKVFGADGADLLPAGKVFPIQIGSELFRLSGASLSSDAPSYFSHFFGHQLHNNGGRAGDVKTLYIDRDPETFRDIALHLQGYHIAPKNGEQYVKLYADAQFYSLPKLTKQLFKSDIFINIGGTPFQIPRDIFSAPGDSPNYFSLGFAQFFSTPSSVFPGLDRSALLRPPSISAPSAPNRSGDVFRELLQLLQGYDIEIRNEEHRSRLLRDARYYHLKGLEQRLIPHEISYNLKREQSEILLRLEDIRQSGVSFRPDKSVGASKFKSATGGLSLGVSSTTGLTSTVQNPVPVTVSSSSSITRAGLVTYARPYTDDAAKDHTLIVETSTAESATLYFYSAAYNAMQSSEVEVQATFHNSALARITSLFSVIASKLGLPATQPLGLMFQQSGGGIATKPANPANSGISESRVRVRLDSECAITLDGAAVEVAMNAESGNMGIRRRGSVQRSQATPIDIPQIEHEWLWGGGTFLHRHSSLRIGAKAEVEWTVKRAQWRVRVEPMESDTDGRKMQAILCAVRIEAASVERTRNQARGFLGGG